MHRKFLYVLAALSMVMTVLPLGEVPVGAQAAPVQFNPARPALVTSLTRAPAPASADNGTGMPPMRRMTNAEHEAAADRVAAARAVPSKSSGFGPQAAGPQVIPIPQPGGTPDYFGPYPNWANSPQAQPDIPDVTITGAGTGAAAVASVTSGVGSVTVNNGGSGFTGVPSVALYGGGGSGAAATAAINGQVSGLAITNVGSGYSTAPTVLITGGGGTGATASASIGVANGVTAITITNPGAGYTSIPTVTLTGGGGSGATAAATISGSVSGFTITNAGINYTSAPGVSITGGGGTGATATAAIVNSVASLSLTNAGTGYTSVPSVNFTGGGGTGAAASATISRPVSTITVTNGGTLYTAAPAVNIGAPPAGTTATATAVLSARVSSVVLGNGGTGYTSAPVISFTGGGGTGAAAAATVSAGTITAIVVTAGGTGYSTRPTVVITGVGTGATATSRISGAVSTISVTGAGSGYTTVPVVSIAAPGGGGTTAAATAVLGSGTIGTLIVTAGGTNYTSAPTVGFTGGGGTGAAATAAISGRIGSVTVSAGGTGYTSAPAVGFSGGGGAGAAATALISAHIAAITMSTAGSGYTSPPAVGITAPPPGGTQAAATATTGGTLGVTGITLNNPGTGYTAPPAVVFTGGNGTGAAATVSIAGNITSISVSNGGAGYTSAPSVFLTGGGGTGAAATANISAGGGVTGITITNGGSGYTSSPIVTLDVPPPGGIQATATASIASVVNSLTLVAGGSGYISIPTVNITGGGATVNATAIATVDNLVNSVNVTSGGIGYSSVPAVTFTSVNGTGAAGTANITNIVYNIVVTAQGTGYVTPSVNITDVTGTGATATAVVVGGNITAINVTNAGSGYTAPTVNITDTSGPGAGAIATANLTGIVTTVTITNRGSGGYNIPPTVNFVGGNGTGAAANATLVSTVTGLTIISGGNGYASVPTVNITGGGGTGAIATATFASVVNSTAITNSGTGYITAPAVTIQGGGGVGAAATSLLGGVVVGFQVTNGGSGYTSAPAVTITGGAGAGAVGLARLSAGVTAITITNPGAGYSAAPVISFPTGSGANATAILTGTSVSSVNITIQGTGYTAPPDVTFTGGGGIGAAATATITGGNVTAITVTNGGIGYTTPPAVGLIVPGSGANATALLIGPVTSLTITNPGTGYNSVPTVTLTGGGGSGATAAATVATQVSSVTVTNPGTGYTSAPSVNFTGGGGTGAVGTAHLVGGGVSAITVTSGGTGYAGGTTISITSPAAGGITATAAPIISGGVITGINVTAPGSGYGSLKKDDSTAVTGVYITNAGSGYTSPPTINISGGGGTGATARALVTPILGTLDGIVMTSGGTGYTSIPAVTITGGGGTGAAGTALIAYNKVIGIRKFVAPLAGLNPPGGNATASYGTGEYIPVAIPDTTSFPGSDYYEIALVRYTEVMHPDLPPVELQGYVQTNTSDPAIRHPDYLGPVIVAQSNRPVRIKFTNMLGTGTDGNLFIPVDGSVMGAGMGPDGANSYTENRATVHLHGNDTVWISDGTPHQWTTPANETTPYPKGVDVQYVPDMWFNASGNVVPAGTAGATNNPGPGSLTFYYTNGLSARLQFYHDHAYGLTRLNVYAGEAAGYIVQDTVEAALVAAGTIPSTQIPLVIQDKTFVPTPSLMAQQDPTWDYTKWGLFGNLWFPHVYMVNQNPWDMTGASAMGRWDYGPWFWPPFNTTAGLIHGELPNPYYGAPGEPPMIPGTPNPSLTPEAFMDTMMVNGTVYPTLTLEPKAYRLRILNAANDRALNLQLYYAASNAPMWNPDGTLNDANAGEVPMVPAVPNDPTFPATWPTDGRAGGVPSPAAVGPNMIQIGTEGGFLPTPVVIPNNPIGYEYNRRNIVVLNVLNRALFLGPAERADVIVDFSQVPPGSNLILYNDAPAPVPAFDARVDYYTGDPDQTPTGGAPTTIAGYGPNTRTIMQIKVAGVPAAPYNMAALNAAFTSTGPNTSVFQKSQPAPIVPQADYNSALGATLASDAYLRLQDTSMGFFNNLLSSGNISAINITNGGTGYATAPGVTISAPGGGGTTATATARIGGVTSVTLTNPGSGYVSVPAVTISGGGGTGAAISAVLTGTTVASITVTNGGTGYTTPPVVSIVGGGGRTTVATAAATIIGGSVTGVIIATAGAGYTAVPTITLTGGGGTGAAAAATLTPTTIGSLTITNQGSGYTSNPAISIAAPPVGATNTRATGTAVASPGAVSQIIIGNPGTGYGAPPTITFAGGGGSGAAAQAIGVNMILTDKAIQELFEVDYGRMNATLGTEIPFANMQVQTTIPYGYIDPPTELFQGQVAGVQLGTAADGTQIWKITHNGVDTHWIHFHLFNVQIINRVGWDGAITPPDPNELGWKETVRMNPLELIYIAMRPVLPVVPFTVPNDVRPLDVTMPLGTTGPQFSGFDPNNNPITIMNDLVNFGWSYVWHCHILGHEENDMMRAIAVLTPVTGTAPTNITVWRTSVPPTITLNWIDHATNESTFTIQRAEDAAFTVNLFTMQAATHMNGGATGGAYSYTDTTVIDGTTYYYRIAAANTIGYGNGFPQLTSNTTFTLAPTVTTTPAFSTNLTAVAEGSNQVNLQWTPAVPGATGYRLVRASDSLFTTNVTTFNIAGGATLTYVDTGVTGNTTYYYVVYGTNAIGQGMPSNIASVTTPVAPTAPISFVAVANSTTQVTLTWINTAVGATGIRLQRATNAAFTTGLATINLAPTTTSYVNTGLTQNTFYYYRIYAVNGVQLSPPASTTVTTLAGAGLPAAPALVSVNRPAGSAWAVFTWNLVPGATGYRVQVATNAAFTTGRSSSVILSATTTSFFFAPPLNPALQYWYQVVAVNAVGTSLPSNRFGPFSVTGVAPMIDAPLSGVPQAAIAPAGLTANATGPNQISLLWNDTTPNETKEVLDRAKNIGFTVNLTSIDLPPNLNFYEDVTVDSGTTYYYRVTAFDAGGSATSATVNATTPGAPALPAQPTGLSANATSPIQINLAWVDNALNETGYRLERADDNTFSSNYTAFALSANTTSYVDTPVSSNSTFYYRVFAFNGNGDSLPSSTVTVSTPAAPSAPASPASFTATAMSPTQVNLAWANAGGNIEYQLDRADNSTFTANLVTTILGHNTGSFTDLSVAPSRTYYYRLFAFNEAIESVATSTANVTTPAVAAVPTAPTNLIANPVAGAINLTWNDNSIDETGFTIERALDAAFSTGTTNFTGPANVAAYSDNTVSDAVIYYYRVSAFNAAGDSAPSNMVSAVTGVPPATPAGLIATANGTGTIILTWSAGSGNELGYLVERALDTNFTQSVTPAVLGVTTQYTDSGLSSNTTYYYRLSAFNSAGQSLPSVAASATTTVQTTAIVDISVVLQGGSGRPDAGWVVPLTVKFFPQNTVDVLNDTAGYTFTQTTTKSGSTAVTQVTGITSGTYDITVKSAHTLVNVKRSVVISQGVTVNMGTLLDGNAREDGLSANIISGADFSFMSNYWGKLVGDALYSAQADFNLDGVIGGADFSILSNNWNKESPNTVQ